MTVLGNKEILKILSWSVDHDEDPVITATRKVGRLAEEFLRQLKPRTTSNSGLAEVLTRLPGSAS